MNMNKKLLAFIILISLIVPNTVLAAEKKVTVYCDCEYDGVSAKCSDKCSVDSVNKAIKNDCGGRNSEVISVEYYCNPKTVSQQSKTKKTRIGSSPQDACNKLVSNENINSNLSLSVIAKSKCNSVSENVGEFLCEEEEVLRVLSFVGYLLFFVKLLVPIILIAMGTMDYYKAIVSGDSQSDLKKQTNSFVRRIIAGILIFFIPTIINTFMVFVSNYSEVAEKYQDCVTCALKPLSCKK